MFGDAIEAKDLNDGVAAAALRGMGERVAVEVTAIRIGFVINLTISRRKPPRRLVGTISR